MSNVPLIGLDNFHVARVLTDTAGGTTYDAAQRIINITQANINFNSGLSTFFADNGPAVAYSQLGEVDVTINIGDLTPAEYALLTGATRTTEGVVELDTAANPPELAVGFRAMKSNGEYRYIWLMKGKFSVPNANHQTKEASVNFQQQELMYRGLSRISDSMVMRRVDSDDAELPANVDLLTDWFDDPEFVPGAFNITGLEVDPGTINFNSGTQVYDIAVLTAAASINVTVTSTDTITIAGVAGVTDVASAVSLGAAGTTTHIAVEIENGAGQVRTYTLRVARAAA